MKKILVVAAHPDDEVLGCGGTLLRHRNAGDDIHLLTLTNGVSARGSNRGHSERERALQLVAERLRADCTSFDFNDNALDSHPLIEVVRAVESVLQRLQPDVVYTHHAADLNIDHQVAHQAVLTACRPQPDFCVSEIYSFEVSSATEWSSPNAANAFIPTQFVDITDVAAEKETLLTIYADEMRPFPHTRSLQALQNRDTYRGTQVGLEKAEAFMVIRRLLRNSSMA